MKAKELLALQLEALSPYVSYHDGKPVNSNRFPIGKAIVNDQGVHAHSCAIEYTGTKDEAEIFAMMPDMFRALHSLVKGRKKAAEFKAAFPRDYQAIQTIVNSVMERCDMDVEMDHKKIVDNLRNSG